LRTTDLKFTVYLRELRNEIGNIFSGITMEKQEMETEMEMEIEMEMETDMETETLARAWSKA